MNTKIENTNEMSKSAATIWFGSIVGFFAAIWVVIPTLLNTSYCGDVIEVQNIAPEWVWATKKHPMLPAWVLEILNILTCRSFAVPFIATQLCTLLALWSVWKLARLVLNERLALVATFSMLPYTFFTIKPLWFNQNSILIALWALSISLVFQALQTNRKRYWIGAGIALGLAFHAKYSALCLVIAILAYMLTRESGRKYFRTPGPWVTTLIAFLIFLPHIFWLFSHDFATLSYASNIENCKRIPFLSQWHKQIAAPLHFFIYEFVLCLPTLIVMIPAIGFFWQWRLRHHEQGMAKECEHFLFYCFMVPFAAHLLYSGIKGFYLSMAYGAAFWTFTGLWLLLRFQHMNVPIQKSFRQVLGLTSAMMLFLAAGFIIQALLGLQHSKHYLPMRELGKTAEQLWYSNVPDDHCPYIAGDNFVLFGHAAHAMSVRPSVLMPQGTWANDDDLNRKGGMIIWEKEENNDGMPESLRHRFPSAEVQPDIMELPYKTRAKIPPLRIGIAIVPPQVIL